MENLKENKNLKYIFRDKKYSRETISNINHTNINNNINITNYYPPPSQEYCNKEAYTFINENGSIQNVMNYPIKTSTHKTENIKDSSTTPIPFDKKYHQCQSPYMKKILPSSKRQKSEGGNRIINIYKNSPSYRNIKSSKKIQIKKKYNEIKSKKSETLKSINNLIEKENYYLDLSTDEINNKFKSNRDKNHYFFNSNNNQDINMKKYNNQKSQNKSILNNNKSVISYESNGNDSAFNIIERPFQLSLINKNPLNKNSLFEKNKNNLNLAKLSKSQKNIYINCKKELSVDNKFNNYIIFLQSVIRGFLLRIKLVQYLNLYERIKKGVTIVQYLIFQRMRLVLFFFIKIKNKLNKNLSKYYNKMYSSITPTNNISLQFNKLNENNNKSFHNKMKENNKYQIKDNQIAEIQKELNKKKIDYAVAEKRIKELLIENKKVHSINNIIVRDNKQLALKLKNAENRNKAYNKLKMQNNNFYIINLKNKRENKLKINNLLAKIIAKKIIKIKTILYKYFYKFNFTIKLLYLNELNEKKDKKCLIIENNNFIINENIINKNNNINDIKNINANEIDLKKRNTKLNSIIKKKDLNLYIYRNIFEKWMMRSLIFKSKDFVKEKKKKKKEKFKQRKQRRMNGYYFDKNDKKNEEENDISGDSEDFERDLKYSNKSSSSKKKNNYCADKYKK